ncbi:glycoside hydrolase family 19 protein [Rhodococcus rhodnii]|uniref:Glycoside hydrolase family 19 catalytic domain-containing protein n=2 Tax=Rhodococcus rhodnii TaxID=38312 RepID=R7WJ71_9NOCA|nr:glycoside hydrolase family 19 protein [Rhodococcus rhodnii]EOM75312.1 hypothetical protein Rrhod_3369 [Rhodococcus rhodnii LMG 5362]
MSSDAASPLQRTAAGARHWVRRMPTKARYLGVTALAVAGLSVGNLVVGVDSPPAHADLPSYANPSPEEAAAMLSSLDLPVDAEGATTTSDAPAAEGAAPAEQVAAAPQASPAPEAAAVPQPAPAPAAEPAPAPAPAPQLLTVEQLTAIVPFIPHENAVAYIEPLNRALAKAQIDNPFRIAAFISQLVVESDSFRTFEEYASGAAYEGRADLGNTQAGDGQRYKGRGAIQVTGRHNYQQVSDYTGIDFVAHPELMASTEHAFETAAWYWQSRNLNATADGSNIESVSRLVNGGTHGLIERIASFQRGLSVLLPH